MVTRASSLSAPDATGAVILLTELLSITACPLEPGLWLDILLLRYVMKNDVGT